MNKLIAVFLLLMSGISFAANPPGYLWYNLPKKEKVLKEKKAGVLFKNLSYQQKDAVLTYMTREAWHRAMQDLSVDSMKRYIVLQDYITNRATKTSRIFEKTMTHYPQYRYSTTHPNSALGIKISDSQREEAEKSAIDALSKTNGVFYFYRGQNTFDNRQAPIFSDFAKKHHLKVIPISVDGVINEDFPESRVDTGQAGKLNVTYFPAVILVNPKTAKTMPVSYGLVTQDMLARQFYLAATDFAQGDL
jgi:conjugal transfer pilus assembly protein TraF